MEDQPAFLNQALKMDTRHPPEDVLTAIHQIEQSFGRQRTLKWGPRTLDIDILFYGDMIIERPELKIPHPQIQERRFALAPVAELAPGFVHPVFNKTIAELLEHCSDPLPVRLFEEEEEEE
jgi:2-amino-4-hydroxy-6-hydroxymethyldihydropteridine diphosphokinase